MGLRNIARAVILLISLLAVLPARPETTYLLQSESPDVPKTEALGVRLVGGYESGYIPDALAGLEIGYGALDWLRLGGSLTFTYLLDQNRFGVSGFDLSSRFLLWKGKREDCFTLYAKYAQAPGDPVIIDYPGSLTGIGSTISPRGDSGIDLSAGAAGVFSLPSGFGFLFDAAYSRTELRNWYPLFDAEGYKNRLFLNLVPAYIVPGSLMIGVQNRLTWWFERGWMYDVMPQINWEIFPGFTLSAGGAVPVFGGNVWKAYAAVSYEFSLEQQITVIREGNNIRLRVYFNFLGDKADLFEPQNTKYGAQNRRLIDKVAAFISEYDDYLVVVEGHTNRAKFNMSFAQEQGQEMLPLARARASAVRAALIRKGFQASRISIQAYGALRPLADFKDEANNWRNRRVEILLVKKK